MKHFITFITIIFLSGCYAEWDVPKVPRRDPCSKRIEHKYVYVYPDCAYPSPQPPLSPPPR